MKAYLQVQKLQFIVERNKTTLKRPTALDNAAKDKQKAIYNVDMAKYKAKMKPRHKKAHSTILLCFSVTIQITQKAITARNL